MAERQVVFYECLSIENFPVFDPLTAVEAINHLDDEDWRISDYDTELAVIVDGVGTGTTPSRLRFIRIRPDAPYVLSSARELSLVEVSEDESISEFTYAVIWPDGFMAAISSRDAPSHKRLGRYFAETSGQRTHIVNLFQPDVVGRLRELREGGLRNVQVKIRTSNIQQVEADKDVRGFSQLWNAGRGTEAATIGIELSVGRQRDARLSDEIAREAEEIAAAGDLLETMTVRGRDQDGTIQTINMKKERIRAAIDLRPSDSGSRIYSRIEQARTFVEDQIGSLDRAARGN